MRSLGKHQVKRLYRRKALQLGSITSDPDALWRNIALQLQERLRFPIWPGIFSNNLAYRHHNVVACWPNGLWIDSSPLNTPHPASLSLDNMPGHHHTHSHFRPTQPEPSCPGSPDFSQVSRVARSRCASERAWRDTGQRLQERWKIWRGFGSSPCGCLYQVTVVRDMTLG